MANLLESGTPGLSVISLLLFLAVVTYVYFSTASGNES